MMLSEITLRVFGIVLPALVICFGFFMITNPYKCYKLHQWWMTKGHSEPTKFFIVMTRVGGVFAILVGIFAIAFSVIGVSGF